MSRRAAFSLLTIAALACSAIAADDSPPNVILILADDLGYETLSCNGGTSYATPELDALAASGVRFRHTYSTPLCTPSRVQIMTGKYGFRNYAGFGYLKSGARTFAHVLKDAGYDTCVVGKWQLAGRERRRMYSGRTGTTPEQAGFDEYCLWQVSEVSGSRYRDPHLSVNEPESRRLGGEYGPDVFCKFAQEFITRKRDRPFFVYYPMVLVHDPFQPPPGHPEYDGPATKVRRSDEKYFADQVAYMDTIVGRLIRTLEETGQRDDTLVIFTGDNGTGRTIDSQLDGRTVRGHKGHPDDAGTHVPFIVSWPDRIPGGRTSDALVDFTDVLPTFHELVDSPAPADGADGISLLPELLGRTGPRREWVYCYYAPNWGRFPARRWAHDREWKLYADGALFHFASDPEEQAPRDRGELDEPARARVDALAKVLERYEPPVREQPNVIVILTDDQGTIDAGAFGADDLHTPHLDRIASAGVRFTSFYAGAPVCSPSRACLLTGKSPQAAGVPGNVSPSSAKPSGLPPEEVTLAEVFRAAGYRTGLVGKWHLGHVPERQPNAQGFDYSFGHLVGCIDNYSHFFYWQGPNRHDLWRNGEEIFADGKYFPELMRIEARHFIKENAEQPFFLYFAANAPHYPYQGEEEWLERYRAEDVPYPRDLYGAFLSSLDERIGVLLDLLEETNIRENTIVVFQSDHGHSTEVRAHFGGGSAGPYRGAKFSLFEGGIRVPAMISWPGHLPEGAVRAPMTHSADWLPTLVELCKLPKLEHEISGKSLVSLIEDETAESPHEALHWQFRDSWAVRRGSWKLIHRPRETPESRGDRRALDEDEVYFLANLETDPGEHENLAAKHPKLVEELTALHDDWLRRQER